MFCLFNYIWSTYVPILILASLILKDFSINRHNMLGYKAHMHGSWIILIQEPQLLVTAEWVWILYHSLIAHSILTPFAPTPMIWIYWNMGVVLSWWAEGYTISACPYLYVSNGCSFRFRIQRKATLFHQRPKWVFDKDIQLISLLIIIIL